MQQNMVKLNVSCDAQSTRTDFKFTGLSVKWNKMAELKITKNCTKMLKFVLTYIIQE
jgi:hypothetical protein